MTEKRAGEQAEAERLTALTSMMILDTPHEAQFDEIARLAATLLGAESAAVSLIDDQRQWFKARHNIPFAETPRDQAFCNYAIADRAIVEVGDATKDARFAANPLVTGFPHIRFYAGAPLILSSGFCLGALCVISGQPRSPLSDSERQMLSILADVTVNLIEGRRAKQVAAVASEIVDVTPDAVICTDPVGTIISFNKAAEAMFGCSAEKTLGQPLDRLIPRFGEEMRRLEEGLKHGPLEPKPIELCATGCAGSAFPIELSLARWSGPDTNGGFAALIRDITDRKALERERTHAHAFLNTMIDNLPALLFVKDVESRKYLLFNHTAENLLGIPASDVIGRTDSELFPNGKDYEARDDRALSAEGILPYESEFALADGKLVNIRTKRLVIDGPDRPRQFLMNLGEDLTEIRQAEEKVMRLARFDSLTGLLNRASFIDEFERRLQEGGQLALLSIDLDRFKSVNDRFGHIAADDILVEAADRLRAVAPAGAVLARIGGDEFTMIMAGDDLVSRASAVAEAVVRRMADPFATERLTAHLGASIGIVLAPDDGLTADELRFAADLALHRAKDNGRGRVHFFAAELDDAARDRRALESDLRRAIAEDTLTLSFQPVFSVETGKITSFEALARWTHPDRGPISPGLFIGIAEEAGLIETLGERLLHKACEAAEGWPVAVRVAVNISPLQFHSGRLFDTISSALQRSELPPNRLQIEITEGLVIRDVERAFAELKKLRSLGVQILMDDFGTGYSSLSYFQRFPFDKIKVDQSFVSEAATSQTARAIILAVVQLGQTLGMGIVAEGVETEEQLRAVVAAGCTHIQGYFFSRPIPAGDVAAMLLRTQGSDQAIHAGKQAPPSSSQQPQLSAIA